MKSMEEDVKIFGLDVKVYEDNGNYVFDWELPGEGPYDGIYGINLIAGVCKSYGISLDRCIVKMRYGHDVLYETDLSPLA